MRVLGPILRRAKRHGHLDANPMLDLEPQRTTGEKPRPTTINAAQVELLASVIEPFYAPLVIFAAYTGMRAGEIAAVRWGDLDTEAGWVHVQRSVAEVSVSEERRAKSKLSSGFVEGPPKNKHTRRTILLPSVAELLGSPGDDDRRVFSMESGSIMRWDNFRKHVWAPAIRAAVAKSATIEGAPPFPTSLRFHDLRHAFVSIAYNELGLNFRQIAEMSGHRDIATMLNVYTHVLAGWDEALPQRFDEVRNRARLTLVSGTPWCCLNRLNRDAGSRSSREHDGPS